MTLAGDTKRDMKRTQKNCEVLPPPLIKGRPSFKYMNTYCSVSNRKFLNFNQFSEVKFL